MNVLARLARETASSPTGASSASAARPPHARLPFGDESRVQATNAAALSDVTDSATATAYSLGQQLAVTVWNLFFAIVLVMWAFRWAGGREIVERSYADAHAKAEQKAQRARERHLPQSL